MSSLKLDLEKTITDLELEWRVVYDASMLVRAEYDALAASQSASVRSLDMARERLEQAEVGKARVMVKIAQLEDSMLGRAGE